MAVKKNALLSNIDRKRLHPRPEMRDKLLALFRPTHQLVFGCYGVGFDDNQLILIYLVLPIGGRMT